MIVQTLTIAKNTFVESLRQPIYLLMVLVCLVLQIFNTWTSAFSMGYTTGAEVSGDDKLLLDVGLATVFVCGLLLAAFVATAVLSREIENKTVLTVVSKPIGRTTVIFGKYLGVSAAITIAVIAMLIFLMMGVRHGVMDRAGDKYDLPILTFGLLALLLSGGVGAWCNFFYGWSFPQTAMTLLTPSIVIAYGVGLNFDHKFQPQAFTEDLKPQVLISGFVLLCSMYLLTAIATAASARLGQVMTIVVCAGVFLLGLLSNHLVGRHAYTNQAFEKIVSVAKPDVEDASLGELRTIYTIGLSNEPDVRLEVGMNLYYGASPNGFRLATPAQEPFNADLTDSASLFAPATNPGLVITEIPEPDEIVVRHVGGEALDVARDPEPGDFVFLQPTGVNYAAAAAWGVVPNMQNFWLLDAVSQNVKIPMSHVGKVALYTLFQVGAFLCVAVMLFERRDVG